eukprot:1155727-Pelagomonas_calceolata.AAC.2
MIQGTGLLLHKHALSGQGEFDLLHNLLMACTPVCVLESGKWRLSQRGRQDRSTRCKNAPKVGNSCKSGAIIRQDTYPWIIEDVSALKDPGQAVEQARLQNEGNHMPAALKAALSAYEVKGLPWLYRMVRENNQQQSQRVHPALGKCLYEYDSSYAPGSGSKRTWFRHSSCNKPKATRDGVSKRHSSGGARCSQQQKDDIFDKG